MRLVAVGLWTLTAGRKGRKMEHISEVMPRILEPVIRCAQRDAFYRQYYPEHADSWIAEELSGTRSSNGMAVCETDQPGVVRPVSVGRRGGQ